MDLPANIDIQALPGPQRGASPALYFRDEVVWSPGRDYFALAYTIFEATMTNEVGHLLLGRAEGTRGVIVFNPIGFTVCCWRSPWCRWIDESVLVFKAQRYHGHRTVIPLVLVHVMRGFQIVPGSNTTERWINHVQGYVKEAWIPLDQKVLAQEIDIAT